jgi:hypothetical protein
VNFAKIHTQHHKLSRLRCQLSHASVTLQMHSTHVLDPAAMKSKSYRSQMQSESQTINLTTRIDAKVRGSPDARYKYLAAFISPSSRLARWQIVFSTVRTSFGLEAPGTYAVARYLAAKSLSGIAELSAAEPLSSKTFQERRHAIIQR